MPEISRFLGIIVYIFPDDHNPPHIHIKYNEHKALLDIKTLGVLRGNLPPKVLSLVVEWASIHQQELHQDWDLISNHKTPHKIAPLE